MLVVLVVYIVLVNEEAWQGKMMLTFLWYVCDTRENEKEEKKSIIKTKWKNKCNMVFHVHTRMHTHTHTCTLEWCISGKYILSNLHHNLTLFYLYRDFQLCSSQLSSFWHRILCIRIQTLWYYHENWGKSKALNWKFWKQ